MDPLTHGVLGASISYALFGKKLGRHAALVGLLGGISPDADHFVSSTENVLLYVEFHRGFTHSLLFSLLGALIVISPWMLRQKFRPQWFTFWLCALPAYLSHCLLDASTTYGTQLLWPFSPVRFGWDFIAVIDFLFTVPLAIALIIGLRKNSPKWVTAGLIFSLSYFSFGIVQKSRAANYQMELAAKRGHRIERGEVMPTVLNLVVWRSIYLAEGLVHSDRIRVGIFSPSTYREGTSLPLMTTNQLTVVEQLGNDQGRGFERFAWFSDGWVARSPFDETVLGDMRYSISTEAFDPIWGIRFVEGGEKVKLEWVNRQLKRKVDPKQLWSEIIGTHPKYAPLERRD